MTFTRAERAVAIFTFAYVLAFSIWFIAVGNWEFVVYVLTMVLLMALIGFSLRTAAYPIPMLWALSIWGLAHMAGGGMPVDGSVLYNLRLWALVENDNLFILKYDQLVHAYGFGVTAWLLWYLLVRHFPVIRNTMTSYVFPVLASMGLGALNEMIEFLAVLSVPDTNVGGYYNTALDLVFNGLGAVVVICVVAWFERQRRINQDIPDIS